MSELPAVVIDNGTGCVAPPRRQQPLRGPDVPRLRNATLTTFSEHHSNPLSLTPTSAKSYTKMGFAGNVEPQYIIPTVVAQSGMAVRLQGIEHSAACRQEDSNNINHPKPDTTPLTCDRATKASAKGSKIWTSTSATRRLPATQLTTSPTLYATVRTSRRWLRPRHCSYHTLKTLRANFDVSPTPTVGCE